MSTVFLLSPANLGGKRGAQLLSGNGELARALGTAQGAPLGEVFSFVSSLYFRGKAAYARAFGSAAWVMTAGGGLCSLDERINRARLEGWQRVQVSEHNPHFTAPLVRHASEQLDASDESTRFVLLGSVASNKYVVPLLEVFGARLLYPVRFAGLGDMSRGALLLGAVRDQVELEYAPVREI
ncbi:MAG TPA: hypothetical protein VEQ58_08055 [Polyangiaceae bacterium]|nr:hypothetical protein [Polyangiaceae bacterium]